MFFRNVQVWLPTDWTHVLEERKLKTYVVMEMQFHEFLTLAPDGGKQSASGSGHFIRAGEKTSARLE
jgi:hypothetical protein